MKKPKMNTDGLQLRKILKDEKKIGPFLKKRRDTAPLSQGKKCCLRIAFSYLQ